MLEIHPDEHYGKWTTIEKGTRPDRPNKKRGRWLCRCEYTIIDAVKAMERQTTTLAQIARDNNVPYDKLYHQHVTRQLPLEQAIEKAKQLTLC